ncbi:exopolysaccharide biosynthesis polyprenyl glycosylphosphotransferase [Azospirillum sp.]|uniref:exopolysaccharide biosynthesis polyprenyl glycosylphosphotransferase n=1 Tax=Azospirillum sp. TaxID=34012 RepID=UPI003D75B2D5
MMTSFLDHDADTGKRQQPLVAHAGVPIRSRGLLGNAAHPLPANGRERDAAPAGAARLSGCVLIVAGRRHVARLADAVQRDKGAGCAVFTLDSAAPGLPSGLSVEQALCFVSEGIIRDIVIAHGHFGAQAQEAFLAPFLTLDVAIHETVGVHGGGLGGTSLYCGVPVTTLQRPALSDAQRRLKRACDLTVSFALLLVLWPLMTLIATGVALESPGPVLFRQQRRGYNGRSFEILKFRSMHVHSGTDGIAQARRHDPRTTRLGRFLRRSSLDELPQLFNVLNGDMSLVGPRPHAVEHDIAYGKIIPRYARRQRVQPGITGLAQIRGHRGETATPDQMARRIECDLQYIERWSFLGDIRILAVTAFVGFFHDNAY